MNKYIEQENRYCAHNYAPLPVVLNRGKGVYLWDITGRRYIDMMSAYSAVSLGHAHPQLLSALQQQASNLAVVSRAFYTENLGSFIQRCCELTGMEMGLCMNTGAEAVETALKAARKWAYKVKGIPVDQPEIIVCDGNFHGRTIAIVGFSSEQQYRDGFGPFPAGFISIPYDDSDALEQAINQNTAAFLVEPIQCEGGIQIPSDGYLSRCQAICNENNVLLICDEIQTGLGRTGTMLACQHDNVTPDAITLGKALGGGLLPVSMFLARKEVMDVFQPGDHGSTFGGNPLAAAIGEATLDILVKDKLPERAASLGRQLLRGLSNIDSPLIESVRGRGLLAGIEIDHHRIDGHDVCVALARHGILSKETHDTVLRFAPPLIITEDQLDEALSLIQDTFSDLDAMLYEQSPAHQEL